MFGSARALKGQASLKLLGLPPQSSSLPTSKYFIADSPGSLGPATPSWTCMRTDKSLDQGAPIRPPHWCAGATLCRLKERGKNEVPQSEGIDCWGYGH